MLEIFLNVNSILIVFGGLGVVVIFLGFGSGSRWAVLIRDLGVPIGLLGSLIGMIQAINGTLALGSGDGIYGATSVMLLTTLYGGVASAVGYFFAGSGHSKTLLIDDPRRLLTGKWVVILFMVLSWSFAIVQKGPGECTDLLGFWRYCDGFAAWFYEPLAAAIFVIGMVMALLKSERGGRAASLSKSFLLSALISVTCGLVMFFAGETRLGLSVAGNGVVMGLFGYIMIYVVTFSSRYEEPLNANLMNWHWMEVAAFYIFMFLAPDTILDNFQEADIQEQILELEARIPSIEADAEEL